MKKISFYIRVLQVTAFLLVITYLLKFFAPLYYTPLHFLTIVVFAVITIGVYFFIDKNTRKVSTTSFVNIFMAGTITKLFVLMVYVVAFVILKVSAVKSFLIYVLINYIIYTSLEVFYLVQKMQAKKNQQKEDENTQKTDV